MNTAAVRERFLENRIPPPIVLLATIFLIRWIATLHHTVFLAEWRVIGAALFIFVGLSIDIFSVLLFRKANTTINPLKPASSAKLVTTGTFKYSRNPMYLGMLFIALGVVCYYGSPFGLIAVFGFVAFLTRYQIIPEERVMLALFGPAFCNYRQRVRRWF